MRRTLFSSNVSELYEVRERFAERAKRRELHPAHEETKLEIAKDFLKDLAACDTKDIELCYLTEPIQYLRDAVDNFHAVVASNAEAKAQIVVGENKEKKQALIDTWRKFVNRCNALAEWQNDPKLNDFIDQINVVIAQNNATYAAEKTRKAKA